MLDYLLSTLQSLLANPAWVYGFLFLDASLTTVPLIGVIVLETPVAVVAGAFAAQGYYSLWWAMFWAMLGGVVGDASGYYVGRYLGLKLLQHPTIIARDRFEQAHRFFRAHGGKSLILARFIGPLRTIIPLVTGVLDMPQRAFWFYNVVGSVVWALIFFPLGYFFGNHWQTIVAFAERGGWTALIILTLGGLTWLARHRSTSNSDKKTLY